MYANTIRTALNTHPLTTHVFRDVRSADQLPQTRDQHDIYVLNTQPHHKPGEHWVTLEYTPTCLYYFDPLGLPPHPNILQQLKRTKALHNKPLHHNTIRRQGHRQTCGLHCIYHTLTRSTDQYTMNIFNTDLDFNDRLVHKLVSQLFNVNKLF